jgi:hypothetical protein
VKVFAWVCLRRNSIRLADPVDPTRFLALDNLLLTMHYSTALNLQLWVLEAVGSSLDS